MKIRQGFVSNSSSSAFIICLAKVHDIEKAKKWISDNGKYCNDSIQLDAFHAGRTARYGEINESEDSVTLVSFMGDVTLKDMKNNDIYASLSYACGDDSDFEIYAGGEFYGYGYDIKRDFFGMEINSFVDGMMNPENGFSDAQMSFGAGRDG